MVSLYHGQLSHWSVSLRERPGRDRGWSMGGGKKKGKLPLTQTLPHTPTGRHRNPHSLRNHIVFPITQAPPSPPIKLHTHTHAHQNVVSTCRDRAMKGKEKTLKSRQGMGCWGPGGTWDETDSLLLGFLFLGTPKARMGPEFMEPPSPAHLRH